MIVSLVAAVSSNGVIGNRGALPWKLSGDMARFRRLTMGHAVIMGRSTFASLRGPLAGRRNLVLSRDPSLRIEGCRVVGSREAALAAAEDGRPAGDDEAFVIGGAAVYALFLPGADRLYITWIDADVTGDTLFPAVDWDAWRITREEAGRVEGPGGLPYRFVDYARKRE
jgi:dihydrofolate reductase